MEKQKVFDLLDCCGPQPRVLVHPPDRRAVLAGPFVECRAHRRTMRLHQIAPGPLAPGLQRPL